MHPFGLYLAAVDRDRQQGLVGRDGRPLFAPVDAPPLAEVPRSRRQRQLAGLLRRVGAVAHAAAAAASRGRRADTRV